MSDRLFLLPKYVSIFGIIGEFAMINNYLADVVKHKKRNDALDAYKEKIEAGGLGRPEEVSE